jgi:hypothetical protein
MIAILLALLVSFVVKVIIFVIYKAMRIRLNKMTDRPQNSLWERKSSDIVHMVILSLRSFL